MTPIACRPCQSGVRLRARPPARHPRRASARWDRCPDTGPRVTTPRPCRAAPRAIPRSWSVPPGQQQPRHVAAVSKDQVCPHGSRPRTHQPGAFPGCAHSVICLSAHSGQNVAKMYFASLDGLRARPGVIDDRRTPHLLYSSGTIRRPERLLSVDRPAQPVGAGRAHGPRPPRTMGSIGRLRARRPVTDEMCDRAPVRETGIISDLDPLAGWLTFTDGSIHWLPSTADVSALGIGDEVTIVHERGHAGRAVS